jgi:hypothetical protein
MALSFKNYLPKKVSSTEYIDFVQNYTVPNPQTSKYTVDGEIEFNSTTYNRQRLTIENTVFNNKVVFKNVSIQDGITFVNCQFRGSLEFENVYSNNYDFEKATTLTFLKCTVTGPLQILGCNFPKGFAADWSTFDDTIIEGSKFGSFSLTNMTIQILKAKDIYIYRTDLSFEKTEIKGNIRVTNLISNYGISALNSKFQKDVYLLGGSINGIVFNANVFEDNVNIEAVKNNAALAIYGDQFKKECNIRFDGDSDSGIIRGFHKSMYITASTFTSGLYVYGNIEPISLQIYCSQDLTGTMQFKGCAFKMLEVKNDNHKGNLAFHACQFSKVVFDQFTNYGNLVFSSCGSTPDSEFALIGTDIGKARLLNFDFLGFKEVIIIDSIISNIESSGVKWFKPSVLKVGAKDSQYRKQREVYRQLKYASDKQNDRIQMLEFQAQELECFKHEVFSNKSFPVGDQLILWLSQTNDFGLNWIKPVVWILLLTVAFYVPLVICASSNLTWYPATSSSDVRFTLSELLDRKVAILPQMFNPTRNLKQMFTGELSLGTYTWDAIHRIVLAFFIVQIVSAFRKYFKS